MVAWHVKPPLREMPTNRAGGNAGPFFSAHSIKLASGRTSSKCRKAASGPESDIRERPLLAEQLPRKADPLLTVVNVCFCNRKPPDCPEYLIRPEKQFGCVRKRLEELFPR